MKEGWILGKKGQSKKEFRKYERKLYAKESWVLGKKVPSERELGIGEEMLK